MPLKFRKWLDDGVTGARRTFVDTSFLENFLENFFGVKENPEIFLEKFRGIFGIFFEVSSARKFLWMDGLDFFHHGVLFGLGAMLSRFGENARAFD